MAHRAVTDASGVTWELWDVQPSLVEKRDTPEGAATPTVTGERRRVRSIRMRVSPSMRDGWLAIRCEHERRRIAPIPDGWETCSDAELLELIARSEPAGPPRRLIE